MSADPLVSFVLPCYNYARYLDDCLASIFQQDGCQDFEIIAINDCSTDHTRDLLQQYKDPRLRVIHHEKNRGHILTVNEGLAAARGAFIARIDPDDRYRTSFLSTVLPLFRQYSDVGLVYGDAAIIDATGRICVERTWAVPHKTDFRGNDFVALLAENFICAPTTIARREVWGKVLPVPAGLAFNDWYLNIMMARLYDFCYVRQVLADYRVHDSNHHTRVSRDKTEEASVLHLLDLVYAGKEATEELENAKQRARNRVYAKQYLTIAEKYFGFSMNQDARRCYWNAVRRQPSCLARAGVLRHFAATLTNRQLYELGKSLLKGRSSPQVG